MSGTSCSLSENWGLRRFTLIELLVVISIVSVLISILLPALASARQSARTVICMSNLRSAGIAWNMYTDDFGKTPRAAPTTHTASPAWTTSGWFHQVLSNLYMNKNRKMWYCPEHPEGRMPDKNWRTTDGNGWYISSYAYNPILGGWRRDQIELKFLRVNRNVVKNPLQQIVMTEGRGLFYNQATIDTRIDKANSLEGQHAGKNVALLSDSSVRQGRKEHIKATYVWADTLGEVINKRLITFQDD